MGVSTGADYLLSKMIRRQLIACTKMDESLWEGEILPAAPAYCGNNERGVDLRGQVQVQVKVKVKVKI